LIFPTDIFKFGLYHKHAVRATPLTLQESLLHMLLQFSSLWTYFSM